MRRSGTLGRNVIALTAVSLLTDLSSELITPLLPLFLATTLGASATLIGAIEGAAESVASLLKLASGWFSDRTRRRKPLVVAGYAIASLARPLVAFAQTSGHVLAVRLSDRVGKGIRTSPRDALIADSVSPEQRGRAFGFHRAGDHLGAVIGPLLAFALLQWGGLSLRQVFLVAAVPAAAAMVVVVIGVREAPRLAPPQARPDLSVPLGRPFWSTLLAILLFTLGNSTDAFLLLRAGTLGVDTAMIPLLWALLHVTKSISATPGGALSDRLGRRPLIVSGWLLYSLVYTGFALAQSEWHAWVLFAVYGLVFGLTEGTEKAFVADLVPATRRGSAYGWYHLAVGLGAFPASVLFGVAWDRFGVAAAFGMGAALALLASIALTAAGRRR